MNRPDPNFALRAAVAALAVACALPAWAHNDVGHTTGFIAGLLHPLSGLDHIIAMVAVGVWAAQLGGVALWALPLVFPLVMVGGGVLALFGLPLPGVEIGIAASALALGAAIIAGLRWPVAAAAVLVGFFAIFHGHAHGAEVPAGASVLSYSLGFVGATAGLHLLGIAIGSLRRSRTGATVLRASGGSIAVAGAFLLWRALA